jgi:hypothetical protein
MYEALSMSTTTTELPRLTARGMDMDLSPDAFGWLRRSDDVAGDGDALRARLSEDGYLYLPGALDRDDVVEARLNVLDRADADGLLDPAFPRLDGVMREGAGNPYFKPGYTKDNAALMRVLYGGPMIALFERLIGGPVRHFDYTWLRAVGAGPGTAPHCDVVYMGRGTHDLFTAWTPLGDIPVSVGGLMVLEGSYQQSPVRLAEYLRQDVDTYCENGPNADLVKEGKLSWEHWQDRARGKGWDGAITGDPVALRAEWGGRWLTSPEYWMGDVLIFTMRTVHASIDNQTRYLRLSTDTRYQSADAPVDERWVNGEHGETPIAHGLAGKRGKIC